jgi:hypothetical protein
LLRKEATEVKRNKKIKRHISQAKINSRMETPLMTISFLVINSAIKQCNAINYIKDIQKNTKTQSDVGDAILLSTKTIFVIQLGYNCDRFGYKSQSYRSSKSQSLNKSFKLGRKPNKI